MDQSLVVFRGKGGSSGPNTPQAPERRLVEAGGICFVTQTRALFPMLDRLLRVAGYDVTILLVGETGSGKTTLARLVHELSPRSDEPFQNVACGALPQDLIESELFGHVRGAFTGAERSKIGRFEAAGRGTLLLDEIDVLGPKEQTKLLRVIETGEFEPVGSTETRTSKARLIVASNTDLETLVDTKKFRSDLYYRLNVLQFRLLPLRERRRDIVPLALQFIEECRRQHGVEIQGVDREFLDVLQRYPWPGNLREMKNHIQRAALFCEDGVLKVDDLSAAIRQPSNDDESSGKNAAPRSLADHVARNERQILEEALRQHGYKRTATAKALGISRVGLYKKMRKYNLLDKTA